jgi:NFU1 iron-sulfur cluster scaffold homolog, mitochondrial
MKSLVDIVTGHYIEEVQGVQQIFDQEEEVAMLEFQKFEERLRNQGRAPPPSTSGKGTLDTVE